MCQRETGLPFWRASPRPPGAVKLRITVNGQAAGAGLTEEQKAEVRKLLEVTPVAEIGVEQLRGGQGGSDV